ncbi:UbiD family decarboxylase [Candidatus Formimonas warabiya]|uniref:UbiD family decarboxylase n=1 Tax=Formimonas warabiya TaxID=1761012 RepID=A0A3G1KRD6_FORW1|nr:UbiD family decarboxylase [Candidatus Formimonas warabiya]ATW25000.1 hypothetical protein DCMF_09625 [Candidatus Formimonas warabiya]
MAVKDLREWIAKMEEFGDIKQVDGADVEEEIGVITDIYQQKPGSQALLFDNIPGYPKGYRVLSNSVISLNRIAFSLGLNYGVPGMEIVDSWRHKMRDFQPVPAVQKEAGSVLENVLLDDRINCMAFPTPKWHELDGGRYVGTACLVLTRDPDNQDWVNAGTYRVMVHDEKHLGLMISNGKHGRIMLEKYWSRGQACPVAVVVGEDPLLYMVSGMEIPYGVTEYEFAGAVQGRPVEVVKGPKTGIPVPADAELVFEGEIRPNDMRDEGPFGEWTGYYAGGVRPEPVITVTSILHRNNPIILGSSPAVPPSDTSYFRSPLRSAIVWNEIEAAGIPGIKGVWAHEAGAGRLLLIVSIKQLYGGHSRQAGLIASQCHGGAYTNRMVITVDDDIDIMDTNKVLWAMLTRADPTVDYEILQKCWSTRLDPLSYPVGQNIFNNRVIIDACRSYDRVLAGTFPEVATSSPAAVKMITEKWAHLFPVTQK